MTGAPARASASCLFALTFARARSVDAQHADGQRCWPGEDGQEGVRRFTRHLELMHLKLDAPRHPQPLWCACLDSRPSAHEALTAELTHKNSDPCAERHVSVYLVKMAS